MASWFLTERGLWEDEDLQKALAVSLADAGRLKAANTVLALRRQIEGLTQFPKLGLRLSNGLRKRVFGQFLVIYRIVGGGEIQILLVISGLADWKTALRQRLGPPSQRPSAPV